MATATTVPEPSKQQRAVLFANTMTRVSEEFEVPLRVLTDPQINTPGVRRARAVVHYLLRSHISLEEAGRILGKRTGHAVRIAASSLIKRIPKDEALRTKIENVQQKLS